MDVIDELVQNNARFAATRAAGHVDIRPARQLVVVTCMDSRVDVFAALGLTLGDAHILRNAGGVITDDVIRSLAISQRVLGNPPCDAPAPHGLRDAEAHRRRIPSIPSRRHRRSAGVRDRVVHRRRRRREAVAAAYPPLVVPASRRHRTGIRLRRRHMLAARGSRRFDRRCLGRTDRSRDPLWWRRWRTSARLA